VAAFEPTSLTYVRFKLWKTLPETGLDGRVEAYRVGHLSLPGEP